MNYYYHIFVTACLHVNKHNIIYKKCLAFICALLSENLSSFVGVIVSSWILLFSPGQIVLINVQI